MNYKIRDARKGDMRAVLGLIKELATFEKEPMAVEVTEEELIRDGFGKSPYFKGFVAEINNEVVGTAIVFNRFSTWKGRILHLEDLVVSENFRNLGIGTALLDQVVKYAYNLGVKRINWEVINWNQNAIDLYEKKGATVLHDWNVVHLSEKGINNYISKLES